MTCNLPVVATQAGDVSEQINDLPGNYICTQNPDDIAQETGLILNEQRRSVGREVVQHLSMEAVASRIKQIYEGLLNSRRKFKNPETARLTL